jgi:hypothetical protein
MISEIVLLRFSIDNINKELSKLLITCARPQRRHNVELEIAAKTRAQFPVARETEFIAAFAEVQVCHRADKPDALAASGNLVVRGRTIGPKFILMN